MTPCWCLADPLADLDDAFFTPTLSDAQAHHASVVSRSKRLNEAPLLTSKHRDEEMAGRERRKADKWPEVSCCFILLRVISRACRCQRAGDDEIVNRVEESGQETQAATRVID
jgi:hypothetical protein